MKIFAVTALIQATPEAVWAVLTDAAAWPQWNTTIEKIDGEIALGNRVKVYPKLTPGRAFPIRVSVFEPPRRMVWTGGMPLGLFRGERTYTLTATRSSSRCARSSPDSWPVSSPARFPISSPRSRNSPRR